MSIWDSYLTKTSKRHNPFLSLAVLFVSMCYLAGALSPHYAVTQFKFLLYMYINGISSSSGFFIWLLKRSLLLVISSYFFLYLAPPISDPVLIFPLSPYIAIFYIPFLRRSSPLPLLSLSSCLTSVSILNETFNTLVLMAQGYM